MRCENCGHSNDQDAGFCENCGSPLLRKCTNCQAELNPGARFCKKCGTPVVETDPSESQEARLTALHQTAPSELKDKIRIASSEIEGERKPVTILFTDIVGSTSLAEKMDPEEWKEVVSGAHRLVSQAVYRYEGTIAQLLGDGVLAFFGAPVTHEDDSIRAVHAALDIQEAMGEYSRELKGLVDQFQMRVGLNSGTVVVGSVGSDLHMEYLAIGDAVNLAARLQSAAQPGKVLISDSTARQAKAAFDLKDMGEISVKGKTGAIHVHEVIGPRDVPESGRGFASLSSPLVGRSHETAKLQQALDALDEGHGQIVAVIGEAGIGKTRLVAETLRLNSDRLERLHWIEGRALSYGQTLSFWMVTQLIYSDLGLSEGDPEVKVRAALKRRINDLFADAYLQGYPYLAELLGIRLEGESEELVRSLDGETLNRQTLLAITQYFQRMAEQQPTVAVFEDLHWVDSSSLEALGKLLSITNTVPLMLVLLSRMEREHGSWQIKIKAETDFSHRYTEIMLKPLAVREQNQLVDNLLAVADFPDSVRRVINEHAEGNPFYLEEIVRSLIDQGAVRQEGERWHMAEDLTDIEIPETLEGVLLARIDRLQEDVRRTLQIASVIGKSFLYRLLESISAAEQQLDRHLAQLQKVDLVREKAVMPELEYMFKHSLTQEAAYNSLLLERRREFHRRVGEALETLFEDRIEQYLGLLAYHFSLAGEDEKAVGYLIRAGDRARLTDEHTEAIGYYRQAVELLEKLGDEERLAQVWLKLGLIYTANFQFEAAHQANEKAFAIQQETRQYIQPVRKREMKDFRFWIGGVHVTLDPGKAIWEQDISPVRQMFKGLVDLDRELNVVPAVARSWQVLDQGRRYLFHLRDDVTWTDGSPVTAGDFEYAWKRNLDLAEESVGCLLYNLVGAKDYHEGHLRNPDAVGVHARDRLTLEVQLEHPVAYFPYIVTMPVTFPLPRRVIEEFGEDWWQPGNIISNGPYRLVEFDAEKGGVLERNPGYFGPFTGNVERIRWDFCLSPDETLAHYLQNQADFMFLSSVQAQGETLSGELSVTQTLGIFSMIFSPVVHPLDDIRVRNALAMSVDKHRIAKESDLQAGSGGLVPPGMPGHSPGIALPYDPEKARQLLAEAGYPDGRGFPVIKGFVMASVINKANLIARDWRENLGVETIFSAHSPEELDKQILDPDVTPVFINGWLGDYPDPDNFLFHTIAYNRLHNLGWNDPDYDSLVETAARTSDRTSRMAMYRRADRWLVADQTLAVPLYYTKSTKLIKPWVKNFTTNALNYWNFQDLIIEEH